MSWVLILSVIFGGGAAEMFRPDAHSTYLNTRVPSLYNLSSDQTTGSYWTSSFLTTTSGSQYLALSHVLGNVCKSSLLELDSLDYWNNLQYATPQNTSLVAPGFKVSVGTCGVGSTASDLISSMYTHASTSEYAFNLTWESTSKVLLNGGNAAFTFGPGFANSTEWSIPAATVSGSLSLGNTSHTVNPAASMTWYDHQKGAGAPQNWTWFQLHFPGSSTKASIWAYDFGSPSFDTYRFSTVRVGEEAQYVIPFDMEAGGACSSWTSAKSNITYPQSWTLNFENGDVLEIQSMRGDQEIYGSRQLSDTVYAGYVNVSGSFLGQESGFGVVEMIKLY
ncbi:Secreted hydrolase-like protein [Colletotrichum sp. SAR 10_86]|nr:Secreted hydrolase-like protein [Colletotrichum sp. SAR 10_86]